jgi:hypothetical protein
MMIYLHLQRITNSDKISTMPLELKTVWVVPHEIGMVFEAKRSEKKISA